MVMRQVQRSAACGSRIFGAVQPGQVVSGIEDDQDRRVTVAPVPADQRSGRRGWRARQRRSQCRRLSAENGPTTSQHSLKVGTALDPIGVSYGMRTAHAAAADIDPPA
jgi:hypothetical protein